jgi:hypothetical protein
MSTYEQAQNAIASYTRNKTNDHLLEDLKSIFAKYGKLNSSAIQASGTASVTTYRSRFGSLSSAIREAGLECEVTEGSLQKCRAIRSIRARLMEDIVLASTGRVRIDDRRNYRFRSCLRVKRTQQLVAVAIARCYKDYKDNVRWRIRCLHNERNFILLLARLDETNDSLSDLFVAPPLRKGNQVSVSKNDRRLSDVVRLTDLANFDAAVKAISTRIEPMNWAWYEPSDTLATAHQLMRIQKANKKDLIRRGMNQKTLERIRQRIPVRASKLALCLRVLNEAEAARAE